LHCARTGPSLSGCLGSGDVLRSPCGRFWLLHGLFSIDAVNPTKTLKPDATVSGRKGIAMHHLFCTDVDLADLITSLLTLGLGIFFFCLPPERTKPTSASKKTQTEAP